jgi:hypothetical protein
MVIDFSLREQAIKEGFSQAQKFTWPAAAQRLLNVYQHLLGTD